MCVRLGYTMVVTDFCFEFCSEIPEGSDAILSQGEYHLRGRLGAAAWVLVLCAAGGPIAPEGRHAISAAAAVSFGSQFSISRSR